MESSEKHLKEQHHIHYPPPHDQGRQQDPSIRSTCTPLAHFAHLYGPNSGHTCDEEHRAPHTDQASLPECSWLGRNSNFGRHHLNIFPQSNNQKRARLLRTPGHTHSPQHSLERCPDSQELTDATGGLPAVGTAGKATGQGTAVFDLVFKALWRWKPELEMGKSNASASPAECLLTSHSGTAFKSFLPLEKELHTEELKEIPSISLTVLKTHVRLGDCDSLFHPWWFCDYSANMWTCLFLKPSDFLCETLVKLQKETNPKEFTGAMNIRGKKEKTNHMEKTSQKPSKDIKQLIYLSNRRQMGGNFKQVEEMMNMGS